MYALKCMKVMASGTVHQTSSLWASVTHRGQPFSCSIEADDPPPSPSPQSSRRVASHCVLTRWCDVPGCGMAYPIY